MIRSNDLTSPISLSSEFLIYNSADGEVKVDVLLRDENIWLKQDSIARLVGLQRAAVTKHLLNIYEEGELNKDSTCSILEQVQTEGSRSVKRNIEFYNLDAIISIGYRVNSNRACGVGI